VDPTALETLWFVLIAVLWVGYFVLEGFDFGVGALLPVLGRDDVDRRVMIGTIGPVWDGNEVWLLTAGGATFAAFPEWYATLFSGFYLPLLLILAALIVRGVAFEFRGKHDAPGWRRTWDTALVVGSVVPAFLWGVAFANVVRGVALAPDGEFAGSFGDLLNPYALLGGVATLALFTAHGAVFLALRTTGEIAERARRAAAVLLPVVVLGGAGFIAWTLGRSASDDALSALALAAGVVAAAAAVSAVLLHRARREAAVFGATATTIAAVVAMLFADLWPNVMASSGAPELALSISEAASSGYTLGVMTVVAVVLTPVVLLYQGWTYWVFRARLGREDLPGGNPFEAAASKLGGGADGAGPG
jgi:cytochrome bd ubiquinol oxidase subunit II